MPPKRKSSSVSRDASPERKNSEVTVYVVFRGEDYEGGSIDAIFTNKQAARDHVHAFTLKNPRPNKVWTKDDEDRWSRGCDYIEIQQEQVFETASAWKTWWDAELPPL